MQIEAIYQLGDLFTQVQLQQVFPDGKTFPDCLPKYSLQEIDVRYRQAKELPAFNLKTFVQDNFLPPRGSAKDYETNITEPVQKHIEQLWDVLTRKPGGEKSSLIPLPNPYIVPGGR